MQFAVSPMRFRGRPLPRDELANRAARIGDLRIVEHDDASLRRHVRIARVLAEDPPRPALVLCELLDPVIVAMSPQAFTLAGFERDGDRWYAQSWLVRSVAHAGVAVGTGAAFRPVTRIDVPGERG
jgi:hypothetical protein